jgi:hypothetical protein
MKSLASRSSYVLLLLLIAAATCNAEGEATGRSGHGGWKQLQHLPASGFLRIGCTAGSEAVITFVTEAYSFLLA